MTQATGPRRHAMVGACSVVLVLSVWYAARVATAPDPATVIQVPVAFRFDCRACEHHWTATAADVSSYFGGAMPVGDRPVRCTDCGKPAAFISVTGRAPAGGR